LIGSQGCPSNEPQPGTPKLSGNLKAADGKTGILIARQAVHHCAPLQL